MTDQQTIDDFEDNPKSFLASTWVWTLSILLWTLFCGAVGVFL
jgi:hypothetical protein